MTPSSRFAFQHTCTLPQQPRRIIFVLLLPSLLFRAVLSLMLLSDLVPTPAFLIDVGLLNRRIPDVWRPQFATASGTQNHTSTSATTQDVHHLLPPILQVRDGHALVATTDLIVGHSSSDARLEGTTATDSWKSAPAIPTEIWTQLSGAFYLHATVVEVPRRGAKEMWEVDRSPPLGLPNVVRDGPPTTPSHAVCRLDLDPSVGRLGAHLVLGLNNHHVGSYYWARSAGSGAAMEAPGVRLIHGTTLEWESGSPFVSNSNDGKRSEWVDFLRPGDQVQLHPENPLLQALHLLPHVYGVSTRGRPLGSEPVVVCRWTLQGTG